MNNTTDTTAAPMTEGVAEHLVAGLSAEHRGEYDEDWMYEAAMGTIDERLVEGGWLEDYEVVYGDLSSTRIYKHPELPDATVEVLSEFGWGDDGDLAEGADVSLWYVVNPQLA